MFAAAASVRNRQRGQALVQGVLIIQLIAIILVGGAVILLLTGVMSYYSLRLRHVAMAAARYGVHCNYWLGARRPDADASRADSAARDMITKMLTNTGTNPSTVSTTINQTASGFEVTLSTSSLPVFTAFNLPSVVPVTVTGFVPWDFDRPDGVYQLSCSSGAGIYFPCYGAGANTPGPTAEPIPMNPTPYWETGVLTSASPAQAGPYQDNAGGGPFSGY